MTGSTLTEVKQALRSLGETHFWPAIVAHGSLAVRCPNSMSFEAVADAAMKLPRSKKARTVDKSAIAPSPILGMKVNVLPFCSLFYERPREKV